jgi:hypothetical protein
LRDTVGPAGEQRYGRVTRNSFAKLRGVAYNSSDRGHEAPKDTVYMAREDGYVCRFIWVQVVFSPPGEGKHREALQEVLIYGLKEQTG